MMASNFIKKSLWHRCFPVNFAKFLRTPFFTEHLRWLNSEVNRKGPKQAARDPLNVDVSKILTKFLEQCKFLEVTKIMNLGNWVDLGIL